MKKILIILLIGVVWLLSACQENFISQFENSQQVLFEKATFDNKIDFTTLKTKFIQIPGVYYVVVKSPMTFLNCTFKDTLTAYKITNKYGVFTEFEQPVVFMKCKFEKPVVFIQTTFRKPVIFVNCEFKDVVYFQGCFFADKTADFKENTYDTVVYFNNSTFMGNANFMNSTFFNKADFDYLSVNLIFNIAVCQFEKSFTCTYSNFKDRFIANYAVFKDYTTITNNHFYNNAEFFKIISQRHLNLSQNHFYGNSTLANSTIDSIFEMKYNKFITNFVNNNDLNLKTPELCSIDSNFVQNYTIENFLTKNQTKTQKK